MSDILSCTVQYSPDISKWSPQSYFLEYQNALVCFPLPDQSLLTWTFSRTTFWFLSGRDIHLYGGGTIDGNGQVWWDAFNNSHVSTSPTSRFQLAFLIFMLKFGKNSGTAGGSSLTFARPIPLTVGNASDVLVEDIWMIGSPFWVSKLDSWSLWRFL